MATTNEIFANPEGTIKALKVKTYSTEKMTHDEYWVVLGKKDKLEKMSKEEWEDLKDMTTSTVLLCLADNTLRDVLTLTNPIDIWDKLESYYNSQSLTSRLYSQKVLYGLKKMEEANFNQYLDEFNKIMTKLDSLEVKIEEEDKSLLLLTSLPSAFDNIVISFVRKRDLEI